jgi:hypothetical protein
MRSADKRGVVVAAPIRRKRGSGALRLLKVVTVLGERLNLMQFGWHATLAACRGVNRC